MHRDAENHQPDSEDLQQRRHLGEHDHADDGCRRRQQRDEERIGRTAHTRHGELVADVRDHRGCEADANPGKERHRVRERRCSSPASDRRRDDQRDHHRGREPVDAAHYTSLCEAVAEHDVEREQCRVDEGARDPERLAGDLDSGQDVDTGDGKAQRHGVAEAACPRGGEHDRPEELDRGDRTERQPRDGLVEDRVHHSQHGAEPEQEQPARPVEVCEARQGLRQSPNTSAALPIRSQATPRTSTRANSSTANAGPR